MSAARQIWTVPLASTHRDQSISPLPAVDARRVEEIAERLRRDPAALSPIRVVREEDHLLLAVGHHHYEAWRLLGATEITVEVLAPKEGLTPRQQALLVAVETALGGALPMTPADRKRCRDLLLAECPEMSRAEVARRCGMSRQSVSGHANKAVTRPATKSSPPPLAGRAGAQLASAALEVRALPDAGNEHALERELAMALFEAAGTQAREATDWLSERVEGAYCLLGAAFSTASAAAAGISSTEPAAGCFDPVRQVVRRMLEKGPETPETILAGVYLAGVVEPAPVADDDPRLPGDCHPEWRPAFTWRLGWRDAASAAIAALVAAGEVALCGGLLELVNGKERP